MCFRLLNLRAAIKSNGSTDTQAIREAALDLDRDLEMLSASFPSTWQYTVINISDDSVSNVYFNGMCHFYSDLWTAKTWNYWRTLRGEELLCFHL